MARRKKPPELIIILDYGGSATKGVYADASLNDWSLDYDGKERRTGKQ